MRRTEILDSINGGNFEQKGREIEEARGWCCRVGLRFDGAPLFGSSIVGMGLLSYRGKRDIVMR